MSFVCPRCSSESHHPDDERFGYCGRCHWWTGDEQLGAPAVIAELERAGAIADRDVDDVMRDASDVVRAYRVAVVSGRRGGSRFASRRSVSVPSEAEKSRKATEDDERRNRRSEA